MDFSEEMFVEDEDTPNPTKLSVNYCWIVRDNTPVTKSYTRLVKGTYNNVLAFESMLHRISETLINEHYIILNDLESWSIVIEAEGTIGTGFRMILYYNDKD